MIGDFLCVAEKKMLGQWCLSVCLYEHVVGSGPVRHHPTHQNGGRTMVPIAELLVPRAKVPTLAKNT